MGFRGTQIDENSSGEAPKQGAQRPLPAGGKASEGDKASFQEPPNPGKPLVRAAQKPSPDPGQTDYPIAALREAKVEAFRETQISETGWERSPETTPKSPDGRTDARTDPPNTKTLDRRKLAALAIISP